MSISDQELMDMRRELADIKSQLEIIPLESGGPAADVREWKILDGNTLPPASSIGVKFFSGTQTLITDDPASGGTRADGIGRIQALDDGEKRFVLHDSSAPYGTDAAFLADDRGIIIGSKLAPDGVTRYYYLGRF